MSCGVVEDIVEWSIQDIRSKLVCPSNYSETKIKPARQRKTSQDREKFNNK